MLDKLKVILLVVIFSVLAGACGGTQEEGAESGGGDTEDETLRVVGTFSVLSDMVENVAAEEVELTTMVGPEEDTHTYEASPSDSRALAEADVVFENGLEFETWLDPLYESSGSEAQRVVVTEAIEPLEAGEEHDHDHADDHDHGDHDHGDHGDHAHTDDHAEDHAHEHTDEDHAQEHEDHAHEEDHDHHHGEYDPHVWQDPNNAIVMVEAIRDGLAEADPQNAEAYEQNAQAYIQELEELDAEVRQQLETIPQENRKLVTGHQVFAYFANRYGFEIPGTAIASVSTEAADPSAGEIARLSDQIREEGVPAIFPEQYTTDERVMERLAAEAGVELGEPLYTDALSREGEGSTYITMMEHNARSMAQALGS